MKDLKIVHDEKVQNSPYLRRGEYPIIWGDLIRGLDLKDKKLGEEFEIKLRVRVKGISKQLWETFDSKEENVHVDIEALGIEELK